MDTPETGRAPAAKTLFEKFMTPIAVLIGAVIIAGALLYSGGGIQAPAPDPTKPIKVDPKEVNLEGVPFIGQADAPVAIVFYYDYQCPFCKRFEQEVFPVLMEKYVETGKARIVLKDFQFLGEDSTTAALFGRALFEAYPAQYPAWYAAMSIAQDDEGDQGFGDLPSIKKLTAAIPGIDVARVEALMNENMERYQAAIEADRAEGSRLGVNGTPSVIVGSQLYTGLPSAQFITVLSAAIDNELK